MDILGHFYYFRENKLLGESDPVISIALYIDEFEVCNPLGNSRKIHKIVAIYWVILNLPAKFRSNRHSTQIAALGKREVEGHFGYERFLDPLIKDVKCLEQTGIFVPALNQHLKET